METFTAQLARVGRKDIEQKMPRPVKTDPGKTRGAEKWLLTLAGVSCKRRDPEPREQEKSGTASLSDDLISGS